MAIVVNPSVLMCCNAPHVGDAKYYYFDSLRGMVTSEQLENDVIDFVATVLRQAWLEGRDRSDEAKVKHEEMCARLRAATSTELREHAQHDGTSCGLFAVFHAREALQEHAGVVDALPRLTGGEPHMQKMRDEEVEAAEKMLGTAGVQAAEQAAQQAARGMPGAEVRGGAGAAGDGSTAATGGADGGGAESMAGQDDDYDYDYDSMNAEDTNSAQADGAGAARGDRRCAGGATSSGAQEQAKVLPGEYDEWKRENYMSERRVKEGGGGKKGGGGGNKRARDGDGSAADMEAPSKKPALEMGEALLFYLPRVALQHYLRTVQYRT